MNPYYEAFRQAQPNDGEWPLASRGNLRNPLCAQYAWAVPTTEAVQAIAALPDIVEMGAGTGYWASLIAAAGGQIRCYDLYQGENNQYDHVKHYYLVQQRGVEVLRNEARGCQTLMLCWPPCGEPFGEQCLRTFRGQWFVYIGEDQGGCCGDDKLFARLERDWVVRKDIALPQWWGIHDALVICERRHPLRD